MSTPTDAVIRCKFCGSEEVAKLMVKWPEFTDVRIVNRLGETSE